MRRGLAISRRAALCGVLACAVAAAAGGWTSSAPASTAGAQAPPRRIISLVPALTEMLFAIGAGPQVVAVSSYDRFPPAVATLPRVGALLDPDVERVLSLTPDLVAIYSSQHDLRQQLARASIPVFDYRHAGLPDVVATIRDLGRVTGHAEGAASVASGIEQALERVRTRTRGRTAVRTLLVFGRQPGTIRSVYASGGRGFLHDMLVAAGGINVLADLAQESVQVTTELLLTRAPDVILELHEGPVYSDAQRRRAVTDWDRLASVPAVKAGRVHIVSGDGLVVPGPRVAQAVERFARVLHPEAFSQ